MWQCCKGAYLGNRATREIAEELGPAASRLARASVEDENDNLVYLWFFLWCPATAWYDEKHGEEEGAQPTRHAPAKNNPTGHQELTCQQETEGGPVLV